VPAIPTPRSRVSRSRAEVASASPTALRDDVRFAVLALQVLVRLGVDGRQVNGTGRTGLTSGQTGAGLIVLQEGAESSAPGRSRVPPRRVPKSLTRPLRAQV
jgi:hypothetical protein